MIKVVIILSIVISAFLYPTDVKSQIAPYIYWIQFSNKNNSPYSLDNPSVYLSERSIQRRINQGIKIDSTDLPVNSNYVDSIEKIGFQIFNVSKWLNGVMVETMDTSLLSQARKLSFVKSIPYYAPSTLKAESDKFEIEQKKSAELSYGLSENQIMMLNANYLHEKNYLGQDMLVAVLDAGFSNVNQISSLQHLWTDNKIIATRDFVKDNSSFWETYQHGTIVLCSMAGIIDNVLLGTAPEASYVLIRTENAMSEYIVEEYNWVCGAEFADSIGANIINSSLGYTQFFDDYQDHSYSDMNGKNCISSIGANLASKKGMIVVSSAGNDGRNPWYRISAPADADGILAVGAVNSEGLIADFSSRGPSSDGRVKPDVCAQGVSVISQNSSGSIVKSNGTSLSAPLITGVTACLWQANPGASNLQIIEAIRQSSSQYNNPDSAYGYGIPDFGKADRILKRVLNIGSILPYNFFYYPNPTKDKLNIEIYNRDFQAQKDLFISVYDILGRLQVEVPEILQSSFFSVNLDLENLSTGVYYLVINIDGRAYSSVFIKSKR